MKIPDQYRRSVLIAIALHVALLIFMIVRFAPTLYRTPSVYQPKPFDSIKAVAILPVASQSDTKIQPALQTQEPEKQVEAKRTAQQEKLQAQQKLEQEQQALKLQANMQQQKMAQLQALQKKMSEKKKLAQAKAAEAQQKAELAKQAKIQMAQKLAKIKAKKAQKQKALLAEQKKLQQDMLMQQLNSEANDLSQIQTKALQGQIDKYKAQILALIQSNWRIDEVNSKLKCIYSVSVAPGGSILSATLIKSSGNDDLDQSARQAIMTSSPLPVPEDAKLFAQFRKLVLTLSPQGYLQSVN